MEIEKRLEKLKREYKETMPSELFVKNGWENIEKLLGRQDKEFVDKSFYSFRFLTVPLLLVLLFLGVVGVSQAAIPGDALYPVKRLSEEIVFKVYKKPEITTERRAQEIIQLIEKKKDGDALKGAVGDYKKSVEEERKKSEKESDGKNKLQERLKKNKEEFRKVSEKSSTFEKENKDIEEAVKDVLKEKEDEEKEEDRNRDNKDNGGDSGSVKGESDEKDNSGSGSHDD